MKIDKDEFPPERIQKISDRVQELLEIEKLYDEIDELKEENQKLNENIELLNLYLKELNTQTTDNYQELLDENQKLKDCVEFYADHNSWDFDSDHGGYADDTVWTEIKDKAGCFTSGKLARKTLKELK